MKHFFGFILLCVFFAASINAQDFVKEVPNLPNYYAIGSDPTTATFTSEQPQVQGDSYVKELTSKIKEARTMNNTGLMSQYMAELDRVSGSSHTTGQDLRVGEPIAIDVSQQSPPFNDNSINGTQIHNIANWCVATATIPTGAPGAGNIYVASGNYNAAGSDTMRIYRSTNAGVSWTLVSGFLFGGTDNFNFVANDVDMEIIQDGTNSWLYLVCRVNNATASTHFIQGYRLQLTANTSTFFTLSFPGSTANNNYYNARVCSDSPRWGGSAYVYFMVSFDTVDAAQRRCRQKMALTTVPYGAAVTVTYRTPGPGGGWNWHTAVPAGSYYHGDICYYDANGTDRVMTVANFPTTVAFPSMYLAWSNDYGVSIASSISITEAAANVTYGARIATNGNTNNQNVMIAYTRLFSGVDWDPYFRKTTNGGITTGDWTGGYIDAATTRSRYVDVYGVPSGAGLFRAAYLQDTTGPLGVNALYRSHSGTWGGSYRVNHLSPDSSFGKIRAGYRTGGSNDCFSTWVSGNGAAVWSAYNCETTVGITNNGSIPAEYSLSQNYPNPFNPVTNIKFSIPNNGLVKLVIFDVTGKEVATIINQNMTIGSYNADFDASMLSSGVYFYKLTAGDFTDTKKMMLVK